MNKYVVYSSENGIIATNLKLEPAIMEALNVADPATPKRIKVRKSGSLFIASIQEQKETQGRGQFPVLAWVDSFTGKIAESRAQAIKALLTIVKDLIANDVVSVMELEEFNLFMAEISK